MKHVGSQLHRPGMKPAPHGLGGSTLITGLPGKSLITIPDFSRSAQTHREIRFRQNRTRITSALWVRGPAGLISGEYASFPGGQTRNPSEKEVSSPRAVSPHGNAGFSAVNRKEEGKERALGSRTSGGKKKAELWTRACLSLGPPRGRL